MAAPHVAGVLARLLDRFPNSTRAQREVALISSGIATPAVGGEVGIVPIDFNTSIPRINAFAAFRQASVPSNTQVATTGCRVLNWATPQVMQATGYKVRTASTVVGLQNAPVVNVGNVLSTSFAQNGFAEVLAFEAQGDGAWSDAVAIISTACAPTIAPTPQLVGSPFQCGDLTYLNCRTVSWNVVPSSNGVQLQGSISTDFSTATTSSSTQNSGSFNYGFMRIRACNNNECGPWSAPLRVDNSFSE